MGKAGFSPVFGPTPWCPMAIGRTLSCRKSSAVLRRLPLSSSRSSPAAAIEQQRLRLNAPSPINCRNLIVDAFVFIMFSPAQISLSGGGVVKKLPAVRQHLSPQKDFQAIRNAKGCPPPMSSDVAWGPNTSSWTNPKSLTAGKYQPDLPLFHFSSPHQINHRGDLDHQKSAHHRPGAYLGLAHPPRQPQICNVRLDR